MINLDEWQKEILNTTGNILLCSGRQVGKSLIISISSSEYALKNSRKSVLIISSTERQAEQLFLKCLDHIMANYPRAILGGKDRPTKHVIKLRNGSIIRSLPTGLAGTGIRGFTTDRLVVDECAFVNDEVFSAVTPQLLTTGGDIILVSTPHGKKGYFWESYNSKHFKVFHVKSEDVIRNRPISATWTEKQREHAIKHLEIEKEQMSNKEYMQEYCGEFLDDLVQFFPDYLIKKCMVRKRREMQSGSYYLGVDIARMGEDENRFEILDKRDKKLLHIDNLVLTKVYLNEVYNKILELDTIYKFREIYVDTGGIGIGVFDFLLSHDQTKRKVVPINNREMVLDYEGKRKKKLLKEDLYNNLLGLMERGEIELLDDDEIFQSFKSVQYEYVTKENALTKLRIFGKYTHIVEGMIRAAWCNKDKRLNIWCR